MSPRRLAAALLLAPALAIAQGFPRTPADYLARLDGNGDGRLDEAEYVAYLSAGFARLDTDGDGVLEASELPGGRGRAVTLEAHQANLRRQFHKLDRNHDGRLSARELAAPPQP
ncbi:EF-hand domain-containing protein [Frateuria defendens]|uniref:EF-hand domain-containing protein n=1 Tax=Frateuria defendens TaxID=2219559 RepID=UPI00066FC0AA|nr:hypothetical protein [Frateuria defendens]